MPSIFEKIKVAMQSSNSFDLSHHVKLTTNAGYLNPICCIPVVPGDTFKFSPQVFCRVAPLQFPVLHEVDIRIEAFYVPNRLLWDNWDDFILFETRDAEDPKPVAPYVDLRTWNTAQSSDNYNRVGVGSLADHLGIPVQQLDFVTGDADYKVSALPFMAYQRIWLDYYCDQTIQEDLIKTYYPDKLSDGDNSSSYINLATKHHRMWRKDYFTSAMPNAQRGADVTIPVTGGDVELSYDGTGQTYLRRTTNDHLDVGNPVYVGNHQIGAPTGTYEPVDAEDNHVNIDVSENTKGELTSLEATIHDLRTAMKTQRMLEMSMAFGKRLKEQVYGFFAEKIPDSRLQRAEYLGGCKVPLMISEVAQTSQTANTPQGTLAGRGVAAGEYSTGAKHFPEHGYFIAILSVVPKADYMQGLARHWRNLSMEDYYWPLFQHIGEQAIRNEELYLGTSQDNNEGTFGYAPRYSDYKWLPGQIHGQFRDSLKDFHMARIFANRPNLNSDFLDIKASVANRAFAVTTDDYDHFWIDVFIDLKATRKMDYFGSPI